MGRDQLSKLKECPHFRGGFCTIKPTSEHFKVSLIQDRGVCICTQDESINIRNSAANS